jgi:hypothetical protein
MPTMKRLLILALLGAGLVAQNTAPGLLPLWNGRWNYLTLGKSFIVTGSVIDVPVTQGPAGAAGAPGAQGPVGPAGPQSAPFIVAENQVYVLTAPQTVFTLTCTAADIYRNGLLQAEGGVDYSVDAAGAVATFAPNIPQAADVVKVVYRCH